MKLYFVRLTACYTGNISLFCTLQQVSSQIMERNNIEKRINSSLYKAPHAGIISLFSFAAHTASW